jgi:hypothetical protein
MTAVAKFWHPMMDLSTNKLLLTGSATTLSSGAICFTCQAVNLHSINVATIYLVRFRALRQADYPLG